MRKIKRPSLAYLLLISFIAACTGSATTRRESASSAPQPKAFDARDRELEKQLEQIAASARGRVGVHAVLIESGETVSLNATEHFPMQSVYKFPIAMAVLALTDAGKLKLDEKVRVERSDFVKAGQRSPVRDENPNGVELTLRELLRYAVSESDGTASDVLLKLAGGGEAVNKYLSSLNVSGINVVNSEKEIGRDWQTQYRNWASPEGAVSLLRALHEGRGLTEESRALLIKLMTETPTGLKRLKGLLPQGAVVAHKTGTSGANASGINAATNDIGIITLPNGKHVAIAVFVSDSPADEATREGVIAGIAKAVWDKWSK